ncbi:MAG: response regulator [Saprospiraceae bacterium]
MNALKIAITDDEALFRRGLVMIVDDFEQMSVCLQAEDGQHLIDQLRAGTILPDILLLDLQMPNLNGIETTKVLQAEFPNIKIIILTTHFSKGFIINMIELGAASYLPKNTEPEVMEHTIRNVAEKGFYYTDEVLAVIRENMSTKKNIKPQTSFTIKFTNREIEILQLICEQYTTQEIGKKLFISPRTVDGHRNNILEKTQSRNTAGLVVYALENGIVNIKKFRM